MNSTVSAPEYTPADGRARAAIIGFVALISLAFIAIISDYAQISLLWAMRDGFAFTMADAHANDVRVQVITSVQTLAWLVTSIIFLRWIYRAHKNLLALGVNNLRCSSQWAVGYYFIPYFSFFRPFQVMKEIWKASDPLGTVDSWKASRSSLLVTGWWALYLAMVLHGYSTLAGSMRGGTVQGNEKLPLLISQSWAVLTDNVIRIPAAIMAILVVRGVQARQKEKVMRTRNSQLTEEPTEG